MKTEIEKLESGEIKVVPAEPMTPVQMTQYAVQHKASPEDLLKFMELQFAWEANEAKKQYNLAVANFKANSPIVVKDMDNTQYNSKYTSKGNLMNTVNAALSEYGLVASFDFPQSEDQNIITVKCILSHAAGHSESTSFSGPPDVSGKKNPIQQRKSTVTYLQIITFEAITGIASQEGSCDDDGNSVDAPEKITEDQSKTIHALITDNDLNMDLFMKTLQSGYKIDSIDDITADNYKRVIKKINISIDAKRKQENE